MFRLTLFFGSALGVLTIPGWLSFADESPSESRGKKSREFHVRAQDRTGVLIPLYVYPNDVYRNDAYNRLMDLKRQYETIPMWVIVNPDSGPGKEADANYVKAIDRLRGAGCVTLGYVTTSYAKRSAVDVQRDIDKWLRLYPHIHGIFFDEMIYEDTSAGAEFQAGLTQYAHDAGCWPTVANPGAATPGRYFTAGAADVIVIHEGGDWPTEDGLKGDYEGGYADHPPFTRAVLLHSQPALHREKLNMVRKYSRWVYATDGEFRPGDPKAANPWDRLSKHLEEILQQLSAN